MQGSDKMDQERIETPPVVFIIEDEPTVRQAIRALSESMGLLVQEFASAEEFLAGFDKTAVGCIVADIRLRGMSGIELLERLGETDRRRPMVIITGYATTPKVVRAMSLGAVTVLDKPFDSNDLWEAIQVGIREDQLGRAKAIQIADLRERFSQLSQQERVVLHLIVKGYINKQISKYLAVSVRTIETRRQHIFSKTGARNLGELMWHAMMLKSEGYDWFTEEEARLLETSKPPSVG